jgi:S-DNA-T family DNA segregation ATPase FtsK/SpoIIIE
MTFRMYEEIKAIILLAVGAFLVFAMFASGAGAVGDSVSYACKGVLGAMAYVLPFVLVAYAIAIFANKGYSISVRSHVFVILMFMMMLLLISAFWLGHADDPLRGMDRAGIFELSAAGKSGGVIGMFLGAAIIGLIGKAGLFILSLAVLIVSALLLARTTLSERFEYIQQKRSELREKREVREDEQRRFEEASAKAREKAERAAGLNADERTPRAITDNTAFPDARSEEQPRAGVKTFFGGLRSKKQENIIDAVMNVEENISGSAGLHDDSAVDSYGAYPGRANPGYGIEPLSAPRPGMGLGDYADADPVPAPRKDASGSATRNGAAGAASQRPGVGAAGDAAGGSPDWIDNTEERRANPSLGLGADGAGFVKKKRKIPYKLPPVDLLKKSVRTGKTESEKDLKAKAQKLEETLRDFRVDAKVLKVTVGPTVTRYEVEPDVGVKIQSIKSLEPDLALRLEVRSVRVVPMPGQAVVGIEAYNSKRNIVTLREIIDSAEFREKDSKIAFVLGKNISGERIIADLADMPHLLIAGTTGSGKSVCINSILLSIIYRAAPDEVKLILVDPKVVELKPYNDIPHLLLPVVTSPERAATALGYAVTIMNERYTKFAEYNVRNLESYNELMLHDGRADETLPQIVIVIDELSDLMMIAPQKVQESISRLAAMARAAGMHLIVATQQPLASILTSVIKANIPSRIAFSVSSNSASRVILDEPGAERLHGKGDMLFSPVGTREPMRIQGSFVSEAEVYKITEYVKKEMDPDYSPDVLDAVNGPVTGELTEDEDDLFRDAVEAVVAAKQASVSMLQRRFRIGYNRSARLVDMMEERGMVAPSDGTNKPRKVLMSEAQLETFMTGGAVQTVAGETARAVAGAGGYRSASQGPDVSGAVIDTKNHVMYGGVPGGEPVADYDADADEPADDRATDTGVPKHIADINDLMNEDDEPPFDTDDE